MFSNFSENMLFVDKPKLFTFLNPYSYFKVDKCLLNNFDSVFSDGILLTCLHNFFNDNKISRFSFDFTSIAPIIFNHAVKNNMKVALIGGTLEDSVKAKQLLEQKFHSIDIETYSGFFDCTEEIVNKLNQQGFDIIVAGLGTPLQEKFLVECLYKVNSLKFGFTCGGFISQIASNPEYFNATLSKLHLRWLQRFIRHGYVRKRVLVDYPYFVIKYCFKSIFSKNTL